MWRKMYLAAACAVFVSYAAEAAENKPRRVANRSDCLVGEICVLPDGTTFRVRIGPTPRLNRLERNYRDLMSSGVTDPKFLERLEAFEKQMASVDPADVEKIAELEREMGQLQDLQTRLTTLERKVDNLSGERRPFRIGAMFTAPVGDFTGMTFGVQWQPPRLTDRLSLLFGAGVGVGYFSEIPADMKTRALFDASATLNMLLGPGRAFLGAALANASDPFQRSWLGVGPTGGYRWSWRDNLSVDAAVTVPFAKPAWSPAPVWDLQTQVGIMWQFGTGSSYAATSPAPKGKGKLAER